MSHSARSVQPGSLMGYLILSVCLFSSSVLAGCSRGVTQVEWGLIDAWLSCDECRGGELEQVVAIGESAVPILSQTLTGLPADRMENLTRRAGAAWRSIPDAESDSTTFVDYHLAGEVSSCPSGVGGMGCPPRRGGEGRDRLLP
jgi:hypothetical protein